MLQRRQAECELWNTEGGNVHRLSFRYHIKPMAGQFVYVGTSIFGLWVQETQAHVAWWNENNRTYFILLPSTSESTIVILTARNHRSLFLDRPYNTRINLKSFNVVVHVATHHGISGIIAYPKLVFDNAQKEFFMARRIKPAWEMRTRTSQFWIGN